MTLIRRGTRVLVMVMACAGTPAFAQTILAELTSRAVAEPVPVKAFAGQWQSPLRDGRQGWTRNRLLLGVQSGSVSLAYIQRYDYVLRFSPDTADIYWRDRNDQPLAEDRDYMLFLDARHQRSQGLRIGWHGKTSSGFGVDAWVSLLQGMDLQEGRLQGQLSADEDRYAGQATIDYRYSHDLLFDHQVPAPDGYGAALDVRLHWQGERLFLALEMQDVWSRLVWRDAPFTRGGVDSEGRNDDGFSLRPLFSGVRGVSGFHQPLPRYTRFESRWQHGRWQWRLDGEYFLERLYLRPGVSLQQGDVEVYAGYEARMGQWHLGVSDRQRRLALQLGTDELVVHRAHSLTLQLQARFSF